jgi:hypothetical protein
MTPKYSPPFETITKNKIQQLSLVQTLSFFLRECNILYSYLLEDNQGKVRIQEKCLTFYRQDKDCLFYFDGSSCCLALHKNC